MIRRNFIRDSLLALAISLVPKVLQPMDSEIEEEHYKYEITVEFSHTEAVWKYHGRLIAYQNTETDTFYLNR